MKFSFGIVFFLLVVLVHTRAAHSADLDAKFDPEIRLDCEATPTVDPSHMLMGRAKKSNNLIRKAGSARRANGQYIRIFGQVVDEDCTPVPNAIIMIWQADSAGKYEQEYTLKSQWDVRDKSYDKYFAYSGVAQTNNTGEFSFVTILPGIKTEGQAPHINMSIYHEGFEEINTMMFFNKHPRNRIDEKLTKIPQEKRELLIAKGRKLDPTGGVEGRIYTFNITMNGINKYKGY